MQLRKLYEDLNGVVHVGFEYHVRDSREPHDELMADCGSVFLDHEYRVALDGFTPPGPTFATCLACITFDAG